MAAVIELPKRTSKDWTYEAYCRLEDDGRRYEILDGELLPMLPPGPSPEHQDESLRLAMLLYSFVEGRKLGKVFTAPLDVILAPDSVVQPDILFLSEAHRSRLIPGRAIFGAPDLIVEVISPGSSQRDRKQKKALYARFGVVEYWLVDSARRSVEVLALEEGAYVLHSSASMADKGFVTSRVLKGLKVKVQRLFVM